MCPLVYNIHFYCFFVFFSFSCFFAVSCCLRYTPHPPPCHRIRAFSVQTIGASCDINAIMWVHPCNFTFHTIMTGRSASWMRLCENRLCVTMSWLCAWFCSFHRKNNRLVCADPKSTETLKRLDCLKWVAINLFVSPPASYDTFLFIYLFYFGAGAEFWWKLIFPCFVLWWKEEKADSDGKEPEDATRTRSSVRFSWRMWFSYFATPLKTLLN